MKNIMNKMKTFSEVKPGDTIFFLIDRYSMLQKHGGESVGFANSNYGLIMCSRVITSNSWEWHNPKTEEGLLFTIRVGKPIMAGGKCLFGPHMNEYGNKSDSLIHISKKQGKESCLRQSFGDYFNFIPGYIFTTKEELEAKVKETLEIVETNLKKIYEDLNNI